MVGKLVVVVAVAVASWLSVAPSLALAQPPGTQVPGVVASATDESVTLANGSSFRVSPQTRITRIAAATASDLAAGQFVAITAQRAADDVLDASVVARFPEGSTVAPGQRPMDESNVMTNANIDEARISTVEGGELTVSFGTGTDRVRVTMGTRVEFQSVGSVADLTPGTTVTGFVNAEGVAGSVWIYIP